MKCVALELSHGVDDAHRHLSGRAGEIDAAKGKAMNPHAQLLQAVNGGGDVDRVAAISGSPHDLFETAR